MFGLVFFVLKSLLGIGRLYGVRLEKFTIPTLKPRSYVCISNVGYSEREKKFVVACFRSPYK